MQHHQAEMHRITVKSVNVNTLYSLKYTMIVMHSLRHKYNVFGMNFVMGKGCLCTLNCFVVVLSLSKKSQH